MLITLFLESSSLEGTKVILDDFMGIVKKHNIKVSISNIEEYWKFENMYKVHLEQDTFCESDNINKFLKEIASKWHEFPDEYLASRTMENCEIYFPNLYMIIVNVEG
jgi:hypothetical protein